MTFCVLSFSYFQAGNAAAQRARREYVDDKTLDRTAFSFRRQRKSHLAQPHNRFRREAENPDFYKRGETGHADERLKRVKKHD